MKLRNMKIQNQNNKYMDKNVNSKKVVTTKIERLLTSSWSIGAIITAISAWTAGILYV
jgi:hypothetical protein